jgi:hypothetical protein
MEYAAWWYGHDNTWPYQSPQYEWLQSLVLQCTVKQYKDGLTVCLFVTNKEVIRLYIPVDEVSFVDALHSGKLQNS